MNRKNRFWFLPRTYKKKPFQTLWLVDVSRSPFQKFTIFKSYGSLRLLVVDRMKTCQIQVVSDLVKPPKELVSCIGEMPKDRTITSK